MLVAALMVAALMKLVLMVGVVVAALMVAALTMLVLTVSVVVVVDAVGGGDVGWTLLNIVEACQVAQPSHQHTPYRLPLWPLSIPQASSSQLRKRAKDPKLLCRHPQSTAANLCLQKTSLTEIKS